MDAVDAYQYLRRRRDQAFSRAAARSFAAFGAGSVIELPIRVDGRAGISIGAEVHIGRGSWLHVRAPGRLVIGDGCRFSGNCVLSAAASVRLGRRVLLGGNVYIADCEHGFAGPEPIMDQPLTTIAPVSIGDGAWLAQNVVVLSGVTIGERAVVGANSVVRDDIPPGAVAVGAPARVVARGSGS